jgi:predicted metal-dependent peptidase
MGKNMSNLPVDDLVLTDEQKREVTERVLVARTKLILNEKTAFFGNVIMRLRVAVNEECQTARTNGRMIEFNPKFFFNFSVDEIMFVFCHEVIHCVMFHCDKDRMGSRNSRIWNYAVDFFTNQTLVSEGIGKMPSVGLLDDAYKNMTSEEIYDELAKKSKNVKSSGFDEHIVLDDQSTEEIDKTRSEIRAIIFDAHQATGNAPACVVRMINSMSVKKMNWKQILPQEIQCLFKTNHTFTRPNRKVLQYGIVLPTQKIEKSIKMYVAVDASGSVDDEMLSVFFGQLASIMSQFTNFELTVWTFDTTVHDVVVYTENNSHALKDYNAKGRGGTSFEVNWDYMKQNNIRPDMFLLMTDGYPCGTWGTDGYCRTLFLVCEAGDVNAPFGKTIHISKQ